MDASIHPGGRYIHACTFFVMQFNCEGLLPLQRVHLSIQESGLSYVGHAHSHDLPKQENTCGLCEILLTELVVDCELSQDPQHKPQSMMNDKEIPIPQIQRDFARQFLPFGVFINMYLLLEYLAAFLNRLRF